MTNFSAPNFRTKLPFPVLLDGMSKLLFSLYEPKVFFDRAFRALEVWHARPTQKSTPPPLSSMVRIMAASVWKQGVRSSYRRDYWEFLWKLIQKYAGDEARMWMGIKMLLSAHHFLRYAHELATEMERECRTLEAPDFRVPTLTLIQSHQIARRGDRVRMLDEGLPVLRLGLRVSTLPTIQLVDSRPARTYLAA
jgi:hypothetical protein